MIFKCSDAKIFYFGSFPSYYTIDVSVADPGFPIGGACTHWGGVDLRCGHFSVKKYVKTKELGPIGGHAPGTPPQIHKCVYSYFGQFLSVEIGSSMS